MTNKKLERVNYILGKAEGVSQVEYDELSKEVIAVWEETINLTAKNLNLKQLNRIKKISDSDEIQEEKINIGEYEVNRYCPHQNYDLLYHSKINLKEKTIECLGHGWKWCLESGKGKNCSIKLKSQNIRN